MAINTATESADRVIIRLTPCVALSVSKPHSYLLVENTNMSGNITDACWFLMEQCALGYLIFFFKCPHWLLNLAGGLRNSCFIQQWHLGICKEHTQKLEC